jgi:hypothetical protein
MGVVYIAKAPIRQRKSRLPIERRLADDPLNTAMGA